jgi:hypothetical protein
MVQIHLDMAANEKVFAMTGYSLIVQPDTNAQIENVVEVKN